MDQIDEGSQSPDPTRRAALRVGAAVAWTVPVMTALGTSPAHADQASGPTGGETEPPPPLAWMASYPLVEALHSKLVVLNKTRV